jgi:16S rRNA (guanine1207-N2)-methyltransferase
MAEHYYSEHPTSDIKEKAFKQALNGRQLSLISVSGVFSNEMKIDRASELLIKSFRPSGRSVLDLGCGYGAIGLFIKALFQYQTVCLSDINERAVDYSILNARANHLDVKVVKSDLFSAFSGMKFDDIVTNPPIAAGKKIITRLINEAFDYLNSGGALWLVAFHNKGGSTLKNIMKDRFGNAEDIKKQGGIRVYKSVRV